MVYIKLLLTAAFWGGTFVAGRGLATHMGPFCAAFWRFALASILLWFMVKRMEGGLPKLEPRQLPIVIALGLTGVFAYNFFFFYGLKTVAAGRAAVIVALNPIGISLLSALFFRERIGLAKAAGITLSVCGGVYVISRGSPLQIFQGAAGVGDLAIMGAVVSWILYSIIGKRAMSGLTPASAVTYSSIVGAAALVVPALIEGGPKAFFSYPAAAWGEIAYLGFFGTVLGFTWYYSGIKAIGPSRASVFINIVPVFAILSGFFILGEEIHHSLLIGAAMVGSGVWLTNRVGICPAAGVREKR